MVSELGKHPQGIASPTNETKFPAKSKADISVKHITEKPLVTTEKPLVTHDTMNDWLRKIATEAGIEDADGAKTHIEWLHANFDVMRDLAMSERTGQKIEAGEAVPGQGPLLQARVESASSELAEEPERWKRFVRTTLAATLRREETKGATPEDEMDVLVRALRPVRSRLLPGASNLMLAARARLEAQRDKTEGYYGTRSALANSLSGLKDEASLRCRAFLHREILAELQQREVRAGAWASLVINTDANNLAVVLDDLGLKKESALYMALAVIAGSAARYLKEDKNASETAVTGLQEFFSGKKTVSPEWVALLNDMGNVPGAWQYLSTIGAVGVFFVEIGAAIACAGLGLEARATVSNLFNAGVTISKSNKSGGTIHWRSPALCRAALNSAGLLWALRHHQTENEQRRFQSGLAEAHGIDCAVNLLVAMIAHKKEKGFSTDQQEAVADFAGALLGLRSVETESDFSRIEQSLTEFQIDAESSNEDPLTLLQNMLKQFLSSDSWRSAWLDLCQTTNAMNLGRFLARTNQEGLANHEEVTDWLAGLLAEYERKGQTWPDFFVNMALPGGDNEEGWAWLSQIDSAWHDYANRLQAGETFPDLLVEMSQELIG